MSKCLTQQLRYIPGTGSLQEDVALVACIDNLFSRHPLQTYVHFLSKFSAPLFVLPGLNFIYPTKVLSTSDIMMNCELCSLSYQELIVNFKTGKRCDLIYISEGTCSEVCQQGSTRSKNSRRLLTIFTATIVGRKTYEGIVSLYNSIMYLMESM